MKVLIFLAAFFSVANADEPESSVEKAADILDEKEIIFRVLDDFHWEYIKKGNTYAAYAPQIRDCYHNIGRDIWSLRQSMDDTTKGWTRERLTQLHNDNPEEAEVFAALLVSLRDAERNLVGLFARAEHDIECRGH